MHVPISDIQAHSAEKNPLKIGIEEFKSKPRQLPQTPTGQAATQMRLVSDKANYGFAPADAPSKIAMKPGEVKDYRGEFVASLRAPKSNLVRSHSTSTSSLNVTSSGNTVFDRLYNPKSFGGIHRARFDESGHGLGLSGRRDDTTTAELIAGHGVILRGTDSVLPSKINDPNSDYRAPQTRSRARPTSAITRTESGGVFDRLSKPVSRKETDYDRAQKIHKRFGSASQLVF